VPTLNSSSSWKRQLSFKESSDYISSRSQPRRRSVSYIKSQLRFGERCKTNSKEGGVRSRDRSFSVKDPNVDVVYVCPFTLTNDVYKYYLKILELVEIEYPEKRFTIIVPENYVKFP
jgi:hypothetical protein